MREHWGMGVGHVYTHDEPTGLLPSEQFPDVEDIEDVIADAGNLDNRRGDPDHGEYATYDQEDELYGLIDDLNSDVGEY